MSTSTDTKTNRNARDAILDVVVALLEENGYDDWQLRDVAAGARSSFATIYKYFPSREELILAAIERWMEEHTYREMAEPLGDLAPFDALRAVARVIFGPWEEHPGMLQVFVRAATSEGGDRLNSQGQEATANLGASFKGFDPAFVADVLAILTNVIEGLLNRYVRGLIPVTDILTTIERTIYRLECAAANDPERSNSSARATGRSASKTASRRRNGQAPTASKA